MPIQFTCPHCGVETNVADAYGGQTGPCTQCGQTITIPASPVGAPFAPPAKRSAAPVVIIVLVVVLVVALALGVILVALLLPAIQGARGAARRAACMNNLKQISLAMLNYESVNGHFPPAYTVDENGNPLHSWRVLILPYMKQQPLYDQLNLDEPWDSPHNLALADLMPAEYRCPSSSGDEMAETSYVMIVGPGTLSDGAGENKMGDIKDGTSNTFMIVEVAGAGINWMEPRDSKFEDLQQGINGGGAIGISSDHPGGANVSYCDGSVDFFDDSVSVDQLKAMATVAGGEAVDPLY